MAQVSIGQAENLAEAMSALVACRDVAQAECAQRIAQVEAKVAETEAALAEAEMRLQQAIAEEQAALIALEQAQANLCVAEAAVALAQVHYEEAVRKRIAAELRVELARQNVQQARLLAEQVKQTCNSRLQSIGGLVSEGTGRLQSAQEALNGYLATNPEAKTFYDWLHYRPAPGKPVSPQDIHDRLNLSSAQQRMFLQYLAERDPDFRHKLANYRQQLREAKGEAERAAVLAQIRSNLSGAYAEKYVAHALGALGTDVKVHVKHDLKNGKYTFTDVVITGLKEPVILGRGEGMAAPKGGSIAIEIKNGKSDYLKRQKDHMITQAEGHQDANASITICTRDIKDLSKEEEEALREALREAGSPLVGMLPRKEETDTLLWDAVKGGNHGG
jgi:multidrug efflux pump subunit AcrA (membrane-fusion protein)